GEEALDLARPRHGELVLIGELVAAEYRDDVLERLVALQHLLDLGGGPVVDLLEDLPLQDRRGRDERVHGGGEALLGSGARQDRSPPPQNAARPSCSSALVRISSWISTVLPTPAPPNSPTLPPLA